MEVLRVGQGRVKGTRLKAVLMGGLLAAGLLVAPGWAGTVGAADTIPETGGDEKHYREVANARGATVDLTLAESIAAALEHHVQVELARWEWEEARLRLEQARAADLMQPDPVRWIQAEAGVTIAEQQMELAKLQTAVTAESDYYNVLRLRNLLKMLDEAVAVARRYEEIARQRLAVGAGTQRDVLAAQAEVARSETQLANTRNALEVALAKFQSTVGIPEAAPVLVEVRPLGIDFDVEQAVAEALERRIELIQLRTAVAAAEKGLELATNDYTAGLTREAARLQLEIQRQRLRQAVEGIELEVRSVYQRMKEQASRIRVTEAELAEAEERFRVMEAMFRADMTTQVELMEAQTALTKARADAIHARFDARLAEAEFFRTIGWTLADREAWERETQHRADR